MMIHNDNSYQATQKKQRGRMWPVGRQFDMPALHHTKKLNLQTREPLKNDCLLCKPIVSLASLSCFANEKFSKYSQTCVQRPPPHRP